MWEIVSDSGAVTNFAGNLLFLTRYTKKSRENISLLLFSRAYWNEYAKCGYSRPLRDCIIYIKNQNSFFSVRWTASMCLFRRQNHVFVDETGPIAAERVGRFNFSWKQCCWLLTTSRCPLQPICHFDLLLFRLRFPTLKSNIFFANFQRLGRITSAFDWKGPERLFSESAGIHAFIQCRLSYFETGKGSVTNFKRQQSNL